MPATHRPEISPIPKTWEIPASIRGRLGRDAGPQRSISEEGHLLLILHQLPLPDQHERIPAFFWRNPAGEWRSTESRGTGASAIQEFLAGYEKKLLELEAAESKAGKAKEYHAVLEELGPILRASRGLHRALQQARELIKDDRDLITFRDQAAAAERAAELLLQDAQFGLNFTAARQAEAQAESANQMASAAHRLNILAALFLPITALTSIFGMEIRSGLDNSPATFWLILVVGGLLGIIVTVMVATRK